MAAVVRAESASDKKEMKIREAVETVERLFWDVGDAVLLDVAARL